MAAPAARLAEELLDETDRLTDQLVAAIWASDQTYVAGQVTAEEVWQSCHDNIARVIQTLAGDVASGVDPYDAPRATGRRRADQRLPLESVLHSYRVGGRLIWQAMVKRSREGACEPDELLDAATSVWEVVDSFSTEVAVAYRSAEADRVRRDAQQAQALVAALLEGRASEVLEEVTAALDLDADGDYALVVTKAGADSPLRAALAAHRLPVVWTSQKGYEVGLVTVGSRGLTAVRRALGPSPETRAGLASAPGLAALHEAWADARLALGTLTDASPRAVTLEDRLPEALLVSSPSLAERLVATLSPLLALEPAESRMLLETLETWLGCDRSPTRTAEALYCHRNTVLNRLQRCSTLTGLRLDDADDLLRLALALRALHLHGHQHPGSPG